MWRKHSKLPLGRNNSTNAISLLSTSQSVFDSYPTYTTSEGISGEGIMFSGESITIMTILTPAKS